MSINPINLAPASVPGAATGTHSKQPLNFKANSGPLISGDSYFNKIQDFHPYGNSYAVTQAFDQAGMMSGVGGRANVMAAKAGSIADNAMEQLDIRSAFNALKATEPSGTSDEAIIKKLLSQRLIAKYGADQGLSEGVRAEAESSILRALMTSEAQINRQYIRAQEMRAWADERQKTALANEQWNLKAIQESAKLSQSAQA